MSFFPKDDPIAAISKIRGMLDDEHVELSALVSTLRLTDFTGILLYMRHLQGLANFTLGIREYLVLLRKWLLETKTRGVLTGDQLMAADHMAAALDHLTSIELRPLSAAVVPEMFRDMAGGAGHRSHQP